MSKPTKTERFNILIEEFNKRDGRTLDIYDEALNERLGLKPKQIQRLIEEFMLKYKSVEEIKGKRRKTYKLLEPMDLFKESFDHFEDIGWFFSMAHDGNPEIFKELSNYTNPDKDIYLFKNTPFEDTKSLESKEVFRRLKLAVKNREYKKIKFLFDENVYDNLKCLKLVFMDNNWYLAFSDNEDKLRFGRISFIEKVDYASNGASFQKTSVQKHMHFLQNSIQNSMTLYGVTPKIATIKANQSIAKYFKEGMKNFLPSQKFLNSLEDGSVIFTLSYTQELEIFPFIQRWLPDLVVLEPQELKEAYIKKISAAITNHN